LIIPDSTDTEIIIPGSKANTWSFIIFGLTAFLAGGAFAAIYGFAELKNGFVSFLTDYLILALTLVVGAFVHELLHALAFSFASKKGWGSIHFGFSFKDFAPYTFCDDVISYLGFATATLLPGVLLGILPLITSLIIGNGWILSFGIFFTAGASGDFLCFSHLLKYQTHFRVMDHPDSIGFILKKQD
jgi:Putative zincin peptidase